MMEKSKTRRILAIVLAMVMALSSTMVSYADIPGEGTIDEAMQEQEIIEISSPSEDAEDVIVIASSSEDVEAAQEISASPSEIILEDTAEDRMRVILKADENAFEFAEGIWLDVSLVSEEEAKEADEELESETKDDNIAKRVTYDIRVMHDDVEIEPLEGKKVKVEFTMADIPSGADAVSIYHIDEEDGVEKIVDEAPVSEATGSETSNDDIIVTSGTTEENGAEADEEDIFEDGDIIDDVTIEGETDAFSLYTVDFTYEDKTVSIPGDAERYQLADMLTNVGIIDPITVVEVYSDEAFKEKCDDGIVKNGDSILFKVYSDNDIWYVDAVNAFTTTHGIIVKTEKADYKVTVTDDQNATPDYLTFTADGVESTVTIKYKSGSVQYSNDGISWIDCDSSGKEITLNAGESIKLRGTNVITNSDNHFSIEGKIKATGDITSLINGSGGDAPLEYGQFSYMFYNCTGLTSAPDLPSTTLGDVCYERMFYGCTGLTSAPDLPATVISLHCYSGMFRKCTNLATAPELPATELKQGCYYEMFLGCTALKSAPELPATTLARYCYFHMFGSCKTLKNVPVLPATKLEDFCYDGMFSGCTGIKIYNNSGETEFRIPSSGKVTSVGDSALRGMFKGTGGDNIVTPNVEQIYYVGEDTVDYLTFTAQQANSSVKFEYISGSLMYRKNGGVWEDCPSGTTVSLSNVGDQVRFRAKDLGLDNEESIKTAWNKHISMQGRIAASGSVMSLRATLSEECFADMFKDCTALTSAPELPATILANRCYYGMFEGCTGITNTPVLPATTLQSYCYCRMFLGCTGLKNLPELPATELEDWCYQCMFKGCTGIKLYKSGYEKYRIPSMGSSVGTKCGEQALTGMFDGTGGDNIDTPIMNEIYYTDLAPSHYLAFTATEPNSSITFAYDKGSMLYSRNGEEWTECPYGTIIKLDTIGDKVFVKAKNLGESDEAGITTSYNHHFSMTGSIEASGSVMSLRSSLSEKCFDNMFYKCESLKSAPNLPATVMETGCYYEMFRYTGITTAPELPATVMAERCYQYMFYGCESLIMAPDLPATVMAESCYGSMFSGCTKLVSAPLSLPAGTLAKSCYMCMFNDCSSLENAPALPATGLAEKCYERMFGGCVQLKNAPELPAATLSDSCYCEMFIHCASLTVTPIILAKKLAPNCCNSMFQDCASLVWALTLPTAELKDHCYDYMFKDCRALKVHEGKCPDYQLLFTCSASAGTEYNTVKDMFAGTGGTFKGTPVSGKSYYCGEELNYIVTYDVQGHGTAPESKVVSWGEKLTKPADPAAQGMDFVGWFKDSTAVIEWNFDKDTVERDTTLYAGWDATFTFNMCGHGSQIAPQIMRVGTKATEPSTPSENGYEFLGWYTSPESSVGWDFDSKVEKNTTVYAKWCEITCRVSYDVQGHGTAPASEDVLIGTTFTKPADPIETGYAFEGWYKESACENKWDFSKDKVYENVILYAKWTDKMFTVKYDTQRHGTVSQVDDVREGSLTKKPADPTETGYRFAGWYKEAGCENEWDFSKDKVYENVILYAKWTDKMFTVKYDINGTGTSIEDDTVREGDIIKKPENPIDSEEKKLFIGWYKEAELKNKWNFASDVVNNDMTLYAKWVDYGYLVVEATSAEKEYNGTPFAEPGFICSGQLKSGDSISVKTSGSRTDVGTAENKVTEVKVKRNDEDVTSEYKIATMSGVLTVTRKKLTAIGTTVKDKVYDGVIGVAVDNTGEISGILDADNGNVKVVIEPYFTTPDAGKNKDVIVEYYLEGTRAFNYEAPDDLQIKATISQFSIENVFEIEPISDQKYTGKEIEPQLTVTYNDETLIPQLDYDVKYSNNTNVGTATASVVAKGNYTGTIETTFSIVKADIKDFIISGINDVKYNGQAMTPEITVKGSDKILKENEDYTVNYANNISVGTATVEVQGMGDYQGTKYSSFDILKRNVILTSGSASKTYDGTPLVNKTDPVISGDGFADGEGVICNVTGSRTEVGTSKNTFTYATMQGTKASNYSIAKIEGELTVTKKNTYNPSGGSGGSGGSVSGSAITGAKAATTPITLSADGTQKMGTSVASKPLAMFTAAEQKTIYGKGGQTAWIVSNGHYQLKDPDGNLVKGKWALVSDNLSSSGIGNVSKFYFDENGYMVIGSQWIKDADGIYRQYFFNDENGSLLGACLMGGTKDDKILNENGQITGYVTKPTS